LSAAAMVIPLLDGGLHCGLAALRDADPGLAVIPLLDGGLHCGMASPSSTGTMAAVIPLLDSGLHCGTAPAEAAAPRVRGHPAARRRAPLRREHQRLTAAAPPRVIPLLDGGLHCGVEGWRLCTYCREVIPLLDGGLHCGRNLRWAQTPRRTCHPAARRRAPLRPHELDLDDRVGTRSSRCSTAGSIAARPSLSTRSPTPRSSHCSTAGSIAARRLGPPRCRSTSPVIPRQRLRRLRRRDQRHPAARRRAPLRQDGWDHPAADRLHQSSRCSTAGSIAATWSWTS